MIIPNEVRNIINILNDNGFEAFIVGGCVRDLILDKIPNDWDITTSAPPYVISRIFDKTIPTGINHGTITVILNNKSFEVTTYRQNEIYTNHRKPDSVSFTDCLDEDLKRRDFTMNAICYNAKLELIDLFGGASDIKNKIIRCIGNPDKRFNEDALRMLRAIRFSSTLGFSIEKNTFDSILKNASLIRLISGERISNELQKIIMGKYCDRFILLYESQVLQNLFPFTSNCKDIIKDALQKMSFAPYKLELRLCILIVCIVYKLQSPQYLEDIFNRLRFNKKLRKLIYTLYEYHNYNFKNYKIDTKILINKMGKEIFLKWLNFYKYMNKNYSNVLDAYNSIVETDDPIFISDLKINGDDLKKIGIKNILIGNTLKYLLEHCFKYPKDNKNDVLTKLARNYAVKK